MFQQILAIDPLHPEFIIKGAFWVLLAVALLGGWLESHATPYKVVAIVTVALAPALLLRWVGFDFTAVTLAFLAGGIWALVMFNEIVRTGQLTVVDSTLRPQPGGRSLRFLRAGFHLLWPFFETRLIQNLPLFAVRVVESPVKLECTQGVITAHFRIAVSVVDDDDDAILDYLLATDLTRAGSSLAEIVSDEASRSKLLDARLRALGQKALSRVSKDSDLFLAAGQANVLSVDGLTGVLQEAVIGACRAYGLEIDPRDTEVFDLSYDGDIGEAMNQRGATGQLLKSVETAMRTGGWQLPSDVMATYLADQERRVPGTAGLKVLTGEHARNYAEWLAKYQLAFQHYMSLFATPDQQRRFLGLASRDRSILELETGMHAGGHHG